MITETQNKLASGVGSLGLPGCVVIAPCPALFCLEDNMPLAGEKHYRWAGDYVSQTGGRRRAIKMYPIEGMVCEVCDRVSTERHHRDGNAANNNKDNVMFLCRRCHMELDGRLVKMATYERRAAIPRPCRDCGDVKTGLRKGLCHKCNERSRRRRKLAEHKTPMLPSITSGCS